MKKYLTKKDDKACDKDFTLSCKLKIHLWRKPMRYVYFYFVEPLQIEKKHEHNFQVAKTVVHERKLRKNSKDSL